MRYTILITILGLLLITCKKDNVTGNLQLTYKSVNTKVLNVGEYIQFTLSFQNPGDNADTLLVQKLTPNCPASDDSEYVPLPTFSANKNQQADILVTYGYRVIPLIKEPQCSFNDTCYFRFVLKGANGSHSDTVNSDIIIMIKK